MNISKDTICFNLNIKLLLVTLLFPIFSFGQVTIASDGLNNSSSLFTLSGGSYYSVNSAAGDSPASSPFFSEGSHSRGVSNNTATLTSNSNINTSLYTSISMTLRLAAFSIGSASNGMDANDIVTVEVSPDGGVNWYNTVEVRGYDNAYWSYTGGTENAVTSYDGNVTPVRFTPTSGGNQTTDGYSTITISGLPATSSLRFRITLLNNAVSERWVVDDFRVQGTVACVPPAIAGVFPTSGPVGTTVTINASSGNLSGATATFNGLTATVISTNATQMVVVVPAGATSGNIVITNTANCPVSTPFTIQKEEKTSCEGAAFASDLIIYEVHDETPGDGGAITIYNGTGVSKDLSNYTIYRTSNANDGNEIDYAALTGILAPGALAVIKVALGDCGPASLFGTLDGGFNGGDGLQLRTNNGITIIDDVVVDAKDGYPGYYKIRISNPITPRSVYVSSEWKEITLASGQCVTTLGTPPVVVPSSGVAPSVTPQPVFIPSCANISFTVGATEGFPSGNPLAYQWYVLAPSTTTWAALTNSGVYSGATAANLNISPVAGLVGYQYYAQVRENTATCYTASNAVMIKAVGSGGPVIAPKTATICSGTPFTVTPTNTLADVVPTGTTYTWTAPLIAPVAAIIGGSAQISPQTSISQILTNTTSAVATATYTVTANSGGCTSIFTITVTVNPLPIIITEPNSRCGIGQVIIGATANPGTINWYSAATAGTLLASGTFKYTTPIISTNTTYWAEAVDGTCTSSTRTSVEAFVVSSAPSPTVDTPVEYCQNSPSAVVLVATSLPGAQLKWYTTDTSTPALPGAPKPSTNTIGSTTYYVSQTVDTCESLREAIVVNVIDNKGDAVNLFCENTNTTATSVAFDWSNVAGWISYDYSYSIPGEPLVTGTWAATSSFNVPVLTPGTSVTFTILSVNGAPCVKPDVETCFAKCATTTIPDFRSIPATQSICTGSIAPVFSATSDDGITGSWLPATVSDTATGTYEFTPDPILFPCASKIKKEVVVVPLNNAGIISGNQNICISGTTPLESTVLGGSWSSLNPTIAAVNATGIVTGVSAGIATIEYTVTGSGVCLPNKKTYTVTITAPSSAGVLGGGPDVCQGQSILFTSTVSGGTWSSLDTAIATVNSVSGSALGISAGTALIKYTVKGTNGCLDAESTLPIKVTALLNAGIISGNQNICIGSTTSFTSTVSGGTWSSLDTAIAAVDATGLVTAVSAGSTKIVYTVNSTGICPSAKEERTITVNPKRTPSFNTIGSICKGNNITLPTTSINNITGSWSPPFNPLATTTYTFIPDAGQCATSTPINQIVTIIQLPVATATSGPISICSGGSTFIDLTADIPGTGTTFSWNVVQTNATGATAGSGSRIEPNLTTTGNKFGEAVYSITPNNSGCKGKSIEVTITVNPIPDVKVNTEKSTICSGTSTNILLTSGVVGTTYTWTVNATPNVVVAPLLGNTNLIQQQLVTNDLTQGSVVYTITPDSNGCPGTAIDVTITVDPLPDGTALVANYTICSGKATEIDLSSTIGASFNWTVIQTGVTGATSGTGVSIEQTLQAGTVAGTVEYIITPLLNGCEGSPNPVIINVNPLPVAVIQEDGLLCIRKDGTLKSSFVLNTNLSNTDYDFVWYQDNIAIPPPLFPLLPPTSSYEATEIGDYYVAITNKLTKCYAESNTALITKISPADYVDPPIITDAFTDNATIIINVFPPTDYYLYQLDFGPLQDFNEFTKVKGGSHIIRVTDAIGCTDLRTPARVISYPKFFTPNGDGYNDTWNINDLEDQPNAKLYIFDRHGKLLKQVSTFGNGWDGTYNGKQLPASDYWFTINYFEDNVLKLFKSHFTLKR